jgi:RNA polymerase sigma-70 factor, ECF subfamily
MILCSLPREATHVEDIMPVSASVPITDWLEEWRQGDEEALHRLIPQLYDELKALARRYFSGERAGHVLQTTALVNEAYVRLARLQDPQCVNRQQFFALSGKIMRNVLLDLARKRDSLKGGQDPELVSVDSAIQLAGGDAAVSPEELIDLDRILDEIPKDKPHLVQLVELRFFAGLPMEEIADLLGCSRAKAFRDWEYVRRWIAKRLQDNRKEDPEGE